MTFSPSLMRPLTLSRDGSPLKLNAMPNNIPDLIWWILGGVITLAWSFDKIISALKSERRQEQAEDLKEIRKSVARIELDVSVLPALKDDVKTHTAQINAINIVNAGIALRLATLEHEYGKDRDNE